MQPLFEFEVFKTLEDYRLFNWYAMNKKHLLITPLILVAISVYGGMMRGWSATLIIIDVLVFLLIFGLIMYASFMIGTDKMFRTGKKSPTPTAFYRFYEEGFEEFDDNITLNQPYASLYKIIECETHIFLMLAINRGCIIPKAACPPQFMYFIQDIKNRYNL